MKDITCSTKKVLNGSSTLRNKCLATHCHFSISVMSAFKPQTDFEGQTSNAMTKVPKDMKINVIFKAISEVEPKVFNMVAADGLNI